MKDFDRNYPRAVTQFRAMEACASCAGQGHSVWSCPVEAAKDRALFAKAMAQ
jgi:hypothetical protein